MLRKLCSSLMGDELLGKVDYYRFPEQRDIWGGPFNGQQFRIKIFQQLISTLNPQFIVETGTFKGSTTEYMARSVDLPIYTVEALKRNYGFSAHRLKKFDHVHIEHGDSRQFISKLTQHSHLLSQTGLFYLDAHWNEDLPLAEELEIIFNHWDSAVILIDDFQVPDDPGYAYDDYGPGKALTLDYLNVNQCLPASLYFPSANSSLETSVKRGMLVLTRNSAISDLLNQCDTLLPYQFEMR